ncbi:hypothetical protein MmiEs2_03900 [Methanimicrococcus stummii]|uniref:Uncharacterized protein n=1 Tax=Methanimicrococcus stummii TaxID=3028294 RepID=A0AA96ZXX1_9EURY|nr:hypothetical protein [Methanimicrococcus sp. Es2]WNY28206.1 hypothetical protein MmiEs2_03900 [Methanimicrococcus sp. Es2]
MDQNHNLHGHHDGPDCGCSENHDGHNHDENNRDEHNHAAHNHDAHARGYDKPLIDGADDECSCACSHHPEDEAAKTVVSQMVLQLDEVIALSSGPVYGEFIANENLQHRLIDLLTQVQEEALSLPDDFKQRKSKADWEFLQTLTIQITHPEFGMNPETLWDIVRLEIPFQNKMLGIIVNGCSHEQ